MAETLRKRKKKWVAIHGDAAFNNMKIGESMCDEAEQIIGRTLKVNLAILTGDGRRQGANALFKVESLREGVGIASMKEYISSIAHVKRFIRKGCSKVDDSFLAVTKDGIGFRVKPMIVLRHKTVRSVRTSIIGTVRTIVRQVLGGMQSGEVFGFVISNKLVMEVKGHIKKIYPPVAVEFRKFDLLGKIGEKEMAHEIASEPAAEVTKDAEEAEESEQAIPVAAAA